MTVDFDFLVEVEVLWVVVGGFDRVVHRLKFLMEVEELEGCLHRRRMKLGFVRRMNLEGCEDPKGFGRTLVEWIP